MAAIFSMKFLINFTSAWDNEFSTRFTVHTCFFNFPASENNLPHDFHELHGCASSKFLPQYMIYHKNQICTVCIRKWFTTKFTIVIFVAFMNCVDASFQTLYISKWFPTRITFMIFVAFMNIVDVVSQIVCMRNWGNDFSQELHL